MIEKVKLPYGFDDLEPYIDGETVRIHYTKHLQTYVDKVNDILKNYKAFFNNDTLVDMLKDLNSIPEEIRQGVINNGGGVLNHNLYFSILSPNPKKEPEGCLLGAINKSFGNVDNLKKKLSDASINQFGSGYGFLVKDSKGKLYIKQTPNQITPLSFGYTPLLNIDVWEHAYYLKYKNLRADYVKNIWNIINWAKIEELYER